MDRRDVFFDELVGGAIRAVRKGAGMTQAEFARKVGVPKQATLSNYERGQREIPLRLLSAISQKFSVPIQSLIPSDTHRVTAPDTVDTMPARAGCGMVMDGNDRPVDPDVFRLAMYLREADIAVPGVVQVFARLRSSGFFSDRKRVKMLVDFMELLEKSR